MNPITQTRAEGRACDLVLPSGTALCVDLGGLARDGAVALSLWSFEDGRRRQRVYTPTS